ncbi:MAG TPA: CHRD domain-containing protein [Candidatus Angelobacter sp.]|jgi:hypothetical protein|nr:CHRD domain-containing protein [Candidatus Angelobacter sp.]
MLLCSRCLVALAGVLLFFSPQTWAQESDPSERNAVITWSADLLGRNESPAVQTAASGKADFNFDFDHQTVTIRVEIQNLDNISKIQLRPEHSRKDAKTPALLTIYDAAKDGEFKQTLTKTVDGDAFNKIAAVVLNYEGVVEVSTKSHPNGELAGLVEMHKSYK